jgi:hypothetical protein
VSFTKNKTTGAYDIIGPTELLKEGASVTVTTKDGGTRSVICGRPTKPFVAKFGPLAGQTVSIAVCKPAASTYPGTSRAHPRRNGTYECEECGDRVFPGTTCWETGMTH